jgi:hypothetical protein
MYHLKEHKSKAKISNPDQIKTDDQTHLISDGDLQLVCEINGYFLNLLFLNTFNCVCN